MRHMNQCQIYLLVKSRKQKSRLYIPHVPWEDISLGFVVGLPRNQRNKDSITVVVNRFSKMAQFVPCNKTLDASHVAELYFRKVVKLCGIPKTFTFDHDSKFDSHYWRTLCQKFGIILQFNYDWASEGSMQEKIDLRAGLHQLGEYDTGMSSKSPLAITQASAQ